MNFYFCDLREVHKQLLMQSYVLLATIVRIIKITIKNPMIAEKRKRIA
jgi:hypothetical protein